jgi:hypothetical protein
VKITENRHLDGVFLSKSTDTSLKPVSNNQPPGEAALSLCTEKREWHSRRVLLFIRASQSGGCQRGEMTQQ